MIFIATPAPAEPLRKAVNDAFLADEAACVETLLREASYDEELRQRIQSRAHDLVLAVRRQQGRTSVNVHSTVAGGGVRDPASRRRHAHRTPRDLPRYAPR